MAESTKGGSPFFPGQPVPVELFVGRSSEIKRIIQRGVGQVKSGRPTAIFVTGEYGIGKTSIARYTQWLADQEHDLFGAYVSLGGARNIEDFTSATMASIIRSGAFEQKSLDVIRNWVPDFIDKVDLFGFSVNLENIRNVAKKISNPFGIIDFISQAYKQLQGANYRGIFLIFDEINGIAKDEQFAQLIKGLWDENSISKEPVPLLLMFCGTEERREELINSHQPIDRIFDVVNINVLNEQETRSFFLQAFDSVNLEINDDAMELIVENSTGMPKFMHQIGDNSYWMDEDGIIDISDAIDAVIEAANDIGRKFVDKQIIKELKSADYKEILMKIAQLGPLETKFKRKEIVEGLEEKQKNKLDNFLRRMKSLGAIKSGEIPGDYEFTQRLVLLYIWLQSRRKED